ncbi:hypothetical protein J3F83DRAFT_755340 [Trichoderma novae-zelandiae]
MNGFIWGITFVLRSTAGDTSVACYQVHRNPARRLHGVTGLISTIVAALGAVLRYSAPKHLVAGFGASMRRKKNWKKRLVAACFGQPAAPDDKSRTTLRMIVRSTAARKKRKKRIAAS